ncbi:MAG: hypothetical protein WAT09_04240 [Paracoccaceae bacterium]
MTKIKKIILLMVFAVVGFFALMVGKWYNTAMYEEIDPKRGVFGMDGMEIWIDINARMPAFAREWGCKTLREREKAVVGWNSYPPYSCQEGFGTLPELGNYDSIVKANLDQMAAGLSTQSTASLRSCFDARMAAAVTPEEIAALNDDVVADSAKKVILAVNQSARECKTELGF